MFQAEPCSVGHGTSGSAERGIELLEARVVCGAAPGDRRRQQRVAARHHSDRLRQLIRRRVLQQEAARSRAKGGDTSRDTPPGMLGDALLRRFERGHVGLQDAKGIERLLADVGVRVTRSRLVWLGSYVLVTGVNR